MIDLPDRELLDAAPDSLVVVDASGDIVLVNKQTESLFGYSRQELLGKPVEVLLPQRFRAEHPAHRQNFSKHARVRPMGERLKLCGIRKDGTEFPVEISLSPIESDQGSFVASAIRDITTRVELSEQRFRAIFQQKNQLAGIVEPDGTLVDVNERSLSFIGRQRAEVIGRPLWETDWWTHDVVLQARLRDAITRAGCGEAVAFETTHPRPDGTLAIFDFSIRPVRNERGEIIFLVPESHDVTARKEAEVALRESHELLEQHVLERTASLQGALNKLSFIEKRLEQAVTGSHNGLWVWQDIHQDAQWWSPLFYELLGYADGEVVASYSNFRAALHPGDHAPMAAAVEAHFEQHTPFDVEYRLKTKSGEYQWFRGRGLAEWDENGRPRQMAGSIQDINDLRTVQEALLAAKEESDRATATKSRFLAAASHDLRQPLQSIGLFLSVVDRNPEKAPEINKRIRCSLDVMGDLLNSLLDISQLDSGSVTPTKIDFPVQTLLDQILANNDLAAQAKGLTLRCTPSSCVVHSDPALLERVVENFVTNAIRYTDAGHIHVNCVHGEDNLRIEVKDSGAGISPEALETIFEEYFQLDNPVRDRRKGLGLGLSIVKHVARILDHPLDVQSTLGAGSAFAVEVPLGLPIEVHHNVAAAKRVPARQHQPVVLFVDDDPAIVDATTMLLESAGMQIHCALNGELALAHIDAGIRPDIIVSDYRLPGDNGVEVIRRVRRATVADLPTILMTGDTSAKEIAAANLSACTVLHKPVDTDKLITLIENLTA